MVPYDLLWSLMSCMVPNSPIWSRMVSFGPIWSHNVPYDPLALIRRGEGEKGPEQIKIIISLQPTLRLTSHKPIFLSLSVV